MIFGNFQEFYKNVHNRLQWYLSQNFDFEGKMRFQNSNVEKSAAVETIMNTNIIHNYV